VNGRVPGWRLGLGLLVWGGALAVLSVLVLSPAGAAHEPAKRVLRFATESPRRLDVEFPAGRGPARGDPVFVTDPRLYLVRVGRVEEVVREGSTEVARLAIYPERSDLLREGAGAICYTMPGTAAWVIGTLLSPEHLKVVQGMIADFISREGEGIKAALWPELRRALMDVLALYEKKLPDVFARQGDRWEDLFRRHRDGVIKEELVPVLKEVSFVLAREKFTPLLDKVGEELWKALPIWSLGFKALWQEVPLTDRDQVRKRFEKYVEEKAAPILNEHSREAMRLGGEVVVESLRDPRVRAALAKVGKAIGSDPTFHGLTEDLWRELVLENPELREVVRRRWEEGLRDAVMAAANRLEPLIRQVVDSVILDESRRAINPRLTRVLRAKVFRKDRRWVRLLPGDGEPLEDGAMIGGSVDRE